MICVIKYAGPWRTEGSWNIFHLWVPCNVLIVGLSTKQNNTTHTSKSMTLMSSDRPGGITAPTTPFCFFHLLSSENEKHWCRCDINTQNYPTSSSYAANVHPTLVKWYLNRNKCNAQESQEIQKHQGMGKGRENGPFQSLWAISMQTERHVFLRTPSSDFFLCQCHYRKLSSLKTLNNLGLQGYNDSVIDTLKSVKEFTDI